MATTESTHKQKRNQAVGLRMDYALLVVTLVLVGVGLVMIYSTTFDWAYVAFGNTARFVSFQAGFVVLGLAGMVALMFVPQRLIRRLSVYGVVAALLLLGAVFVFGEESFGARRALFGGSAQPSEIAKLTLIVYLAAWLHKREDQLKSLFGIWPFGAVVGLFAGVILFQPDLSAGATMLFIGAMMYYYGGATVVQFGIGSVLAAVSAGGVIGFLGFGQQRITEFVNGLLDLRASSYHVQQSITAFVNGGFFGQGLGHSYQKFLALPVPHTDSIFAIVGEEFGVLGAVGVIVLFGLFMWRGMVITANATDRFGALLAAGITTWIGFEALLNIGVLVGLMPFAGNALPFISYGGSSVVTMLLAVGLLANVSRQDPDENIERRTRATVDHRRGDWRSRLSRPGNR